MNRLAVFCLVLGFVWCPNAATRASQVRPVNLEEMTASAATIFAGRCIDVDTVSDPVLGRDVSVARFEVHRAIKGANGRIVTVRMSVDDDANPNGAELPAFRTGDEVVLFLYGESTLGLRAPVGLGQGRFKVAADKRGHPIAMNDLGNRNLLHKLSPAAQGRLARMSALDDEREALSPKVLLDMAEALREVAP